MAAAAAAAAVAAQLWRLRRRLWLSPPRPPLPCPPPRLRLRLQLLRLRRSGCCQLLCSGSDLCGSGPDGLQYVCSDLCRSGSDLLCSGCPELLCSGRAVLRCSGRHGSRPGTSAGAGCSCSSSGRAAPSRRPNVDATRRLPRADVWFWNDNGFARQKSRANPSFLWLASLPPWEAVTARP